MWITAAKPSGEAELPSYDKTIEDIVIKVVMCESSGNPDAIGDCGTSGIKNRTTCLAQGLTQFHSRTFYWMAELAGLEHPEWLDSKDQLFLLRWAIKNKKGNEWSCFSRYYEY